MCLSPHADTLHQKEREKKHTQVNMSWKSSGWEEESDSDYKMFSEHQRFIYYVLYSVLYSAQSDLGVHVYLADRQGLHCFFKSNSLTGKSDFLLN